MSAPRATADIVTSRRHVRFVPTANNGLMHRS